MLVICVFSLLLLLSLICARINSFGCTVNVFMNRFKKLNYNLGVSHRDYVGKKSDGELCNVEMISVGLIFFDIDIEFYKEISDEEKEEYQERINQNNKS